MKAPLNKRMKAYLIDILISIIILGLIGLFYNPDNTLLNTQLDSVTIDYYNGAINFNEYMANSSSIYKQIDQNNIFLNIINLVFIIGYFVIIPYFNKGKTIGKNLMGIEIRSKSNQKITLLKLLIRNLIINGLIYLIAVIICAFVIPDNIYFLIITVLGIVQIGLILTSIIMVLYRKDKKGLHDLLAGTWVASEGR